MTLPRAAPKPPACRGLFLAVLGQCLQLGAAAAHASLGICHSDGVHRNRPCIVDDLNSSKGAAAESNDTFVADVMPEAVHTIIRGEQWQSWDAERAGAMHALQKEYLGFQYFAHARTTFANHLTNTWGILHAWGQSTEICRAGLFHTAFGGDLFIFSTLDPFSPASREVLRAAIGEEAEALTWDFGSLGRSLVNASLFASRNSSLSPDGMSLHSFVDASQRVVSARQLAKIMVITMADYLDQLVDVSLWRDVHSHETPSLLYPGPMKPEVALYWLSRVCRGIRSYLDVVPRIFEGCTAQIDFEDEKVARDLYWEATAQDLPWTVEEKVAMLRNASSKNPFIAEPHVYLAEIFYQGGNFTDCAMEARRAISLLYDMGAQWDKRLPYEQWINMARLFLVRCVRRIEGQTSFPVSAEGIVLTAKVVAEMERLSPTAPLGPTATATDSPCLPQGGLYPPARTADA